MLGLVYLSADFRKLLKFVEILITMFIRQIW